MIKFAYITAPRRMPTLSLSIESLRATGYTEPLYIFAEPGRLQIDWIENTEIYVGSRRRGAMRNFDWALEWMIDIAWGDLIAILQDDMIFIDRFMLHIADIATLRGFGYYNLFTNAWMPNIAELCPVSGWNQINVGWHSWGAMYVFDPEVARRIRQHEFYQNHLRQNDKQIDACVSETCKLMGLSMYIHNPSLSYTVGHISTMGHKGRVDGFNFQQ